jgi:coproporphyrinogen III oxidase
MEINKNTISIWLQELQKSICEALEKADGSSFFTSESWKRNEGGGGREEG